MILAQIQNLDQSITEWEAVAESAADGPYKAGVMDALSKLRAQREVLAAADPAPTREELIEQRAQEIAEATLIEQAAQERAHEILGEQS